MATGNFRQTFRVLPNVMALSTLFEQLLQRPAFMPGMACFSGPSGFGKSFASMYVALEYRAVHVECEEQWTKKTLLEKIAGEMGLKPARTIPAIHDQVCAALDQSRQALILDDAHLLVKKGAARLARHIHDKTDVPVVLVGEEELPIRLAAFEDVVGRIGTRWAQALPASLNDLLELAPVYAPGVELGEDLKTDILAASAGSLRIMMHLLHAVATEAKRTRVKSIQTPFEGLLDRHKTPKPRGDVELGRVTPAQPQAEPARSNLRRTA